MPLELMYESPKRGAGTPLRSSWIAENDTRARAHLEGKGWHIVDRRGTPAPVQEDELSRLRDELAKVKATFESSLTGASGDPPAAFNDDGKAPPQATADDVFTAEAIGVTEAQAAALIAAGYDTADKLRAAPDDALRELDGIGVAAVRNIRKALAADV